jgi:hypothetical protein
MHLGSLDAPERQFVDFCALRALFDLYWYHTLGVALTADRERRARLGVKDGDHLPSKTAKKLVIGLIAVCRKLTQFFELSLWQFNNDVKPNIRLTRPGKVASGVNVSGGHIQGRQSLCCRSGDSACDHERAPKMKRQIRTYLQGKTTLLCAWHRSYPHLAFAGMTTFDVTSGIPDDAWKPQAPEKPSIDPLLFEI